jgi:hypothetical protein
VLTLALYGLLALGLIATLYLVAVRLLPAGEQIAPPVRDEPIWALPAERALYAGDIAEVRLPVALRGYRFAETDLLLDRLAAELQARDHEIARLRGPSGALLAAPVGPAQAASGEPEASPPTASGQPAPAGPDAPAEPAGPGGPAPTGSGALAPTASGAPAPADRPDATGAPRPEHGGHDG